MTDLKEFEKSKWQGPVFMTPRDLSAMLQISESLVFKMVRQKTIRFYRVNEKSIRFDPEDIRAWLEERKNEEYHIECVRKRSPGRPRKFISGEYHRDKV